MKDVLVSRLHLDARLFSLMGEEGLKVSYFMVAMQKRVLLSGKSIT